MLSLDDPRWKSLIGAYRLPYDPARALRKLEANEEVDGVWQELWNELHHQGDVDEASYATVPQLVRIQKDHSRLGWNFFAIVSTIEIERHRKKNPPLPEWLNDDYSMAWRELFDLALAELTAADSDLAVRAALATLAIAKNNRKFGAIILMWDNSEIDEILDEHFAWSELYN